MFQESSGARTTSVRDSDIKQWRKTAELFNDITSVMAQGIMVYDDENIVFANDRVAELLDLPTDLIQPGKPWHDFLEYSLKRGDFGAPHKCKSIVRDFQEKVRDKEPYTNYRKCPNNRYVRVDVQPRLNGGGAIATYTDISEQKAHEIELEVAQRQMLAEHRAVTSFLGDMGHDIRTPMNGVLGMADVLLETTLDDDQQLFVQTIIDSGSSLLDIINQMLDVLKLEAGTFSLGHKAFNLRGMIEDLRKHFEAELTQQQIELNIRYHPDVPEAFFGDAQRTRQILVNLLEIVIHRTTGGSVGLNVFGRRNFDTFELEIDISETDTGVSDLNIRNHPPQGPATSELYGDNIDSKSLDLAIAERLAVLMKGEVQIERNTDRRPEALLRAVFEIAHEFSQFEAVEPVTLENAYILVVDDLPVNRRILKEQLGARKAVVEAASSGQEGLAKMRHAASLGQSFDLIIVDYQMPQMDGNRFCKEIEMSSDLIGTPVIVLSSVEDAVFSSTEDAKSYNNFLLKPVKSNDLLAAVKAALPAGLTAKKTAINAKDGTPADELRSQESAAPVEILVADDNRTNQLIIDNMLKGTGFTPVFAENGEVAFNNFEALRPPIIIMDWAMPVVDGLEATRKIRNFEREHDLEPCLIIAMTANAMREDKNACLDAGMDDYLTKPVSKAELLTKLLTYSSGQVAFPSHDRAEMSP